MTDRYGITYFVDTPNHTVMAIPVNGSAYVFAGVPGVAGADLGGSADNPSKFNNPSGVALDADGLLYVVDSGNGTIRHLLSRYYAYPVAGHPSLPRQRRDGCGERATFSLPTSIKIEQDGSIYIWDDGVLRRARVHKVRITQQPDDVEIKKNETATLTTAFERVGTSGTPYRWFIGDGLSAGDSRELHGQGSDGILNVSPTETTRYWAGLYDGCSRAATRTATVTVRGATRRRAARH